ncbi:MULTISPECIES: heavy-metal-associated domain-containing protein [Clostridia]|uniref:heavy-metal-associated domain-containing protein n=1 Tax=Clostridia TaxID=186801 RepID=UPI000EA231D2|nr:MULTISPECIES: heavy-metal-associated domain-containing protein [Clostridia]NBJ70634.1 copper chaperone [Roseburia sp. 1XD42-34]RKI76632.1 copper chaperone [Clostridium sp. 1xD42-85]
MAKAIIQLEPLTCPSCIRKIETALGKVTGVQTVKVLFNASKAKVEFDDAKANIEQLEEAITKLGYSVLSKTIA